MILSSLSSREEKRDRESGHRVRKENARTHTYNDTVRTMGSNVLNFILSYLPRCSALNFSIERQDHRVVYQQSVTWARIVDEMNQATYLDT